jgi:hypothetical protein
LKPETKTNLELESTKKNLKPRLFRSAGLGRRAQACAKYFTVSLPFLTVFYHETDFKMSLAGDKIT